MHRIPTLPALLVLFASLVAPLGLVAQDLTPFAGVLDTTGLTLQPKELAPGVYALLSPRPFGDNSGFVVGDRGVLVIDSLVDAEGARAVQSAIRTVTDKPILYLVNTNATADHWFGNYAFPATTTVIAHRNAEPKMAQFDKLKQDIAFFAGGEARLADVRPRPADLFLGGDALTLDLGGIAVELLHFGTGNTREDLVVYVPAARVAWTGNFMLGNHLIPLLSGPARADLYLDAVTRFARGLDVGVIVPGHGGLTTPESAVPLYLAYLSDLAQSVRRAARDGASPTTIVERVPLRAEFAPEPGREAYARIFQAINTLNTLQSSAATVEAPKASPVSNLRSLHGFYFRDIVAAAEQVDAGDYGFRPTDEVRTFGALIGHIAQASYGLCSIARGVDPPAERRAIEERASELGKGGLARELVAARDYCDATFAELKNADTVSERGTAALSGGLFEGQPVSVAGVLTFQVAHLTNHWGNLVTYLRLLGEVPPSTARTQTAGP